MGRKLTQKKNGRELLWLVCRHHVMILAKVFSLCFVLSSSPGILLFKRFKNIWQEIEQRSFPGIEIKEYSKYFKKFTVACFKSVDRLLIIRNDYKELNELTLVV